VQGKGGANALPGLHQELYAFQLQNKETAKRQESGESPPLDQGVYFQNVA
jgi:hypothetical protein